MATVKYRGSNTTPMGPEGKDLSQVQPPAHIAGLEEQVKAQRPDLDVYWSPQFLEGSHGDVVSWTLNADEPSPGVRAARLDFDTIDREAAENIWAESQRQTTAWDSEAQAPTEHLMSHTAFMEQFYNEQRPDASEIVDYYGTTETEPDSAVDPTEYVSSYFVVGSDESGGFSAEAEAGYQVIHSWSANGEIHGEFGNWTPVATEKSLDEARAIARDYAQQEQVQGVHNAPTGGGLPPALQSQIPASGHSNYETYVVDTEIFDKNHEGAALREAVVELDHSGLAADDLETLTGIDPEDIFQGPEGLREFVENLPKEGSGAMKLTTENLDLTQVNWQEIYDRQVERAGLAGDGGFADREQARHMGIHQIEGRIQAAEVQRIRYLPTGVETEPMLQHRQRFELNDLNKAAATFLQEASAVPGPGVDQSVDIAARGPVTALSTQSQQANMPGTTPGMGMN